MKRAHTGSGLLGVVTLPMAAGMGAAARVAHALGYALPSRVSGRPPVSVGAWKAPSGCGDGWGRALAAQGAPMSARVPSSSVSSGSPASTHGEPSGSERSQSTGASALAST